MQNDDMWPTPPWCVDALMAKESFIGSILEPACGAGHISKKLVEKYGDSQVISQNLHDYGYGESGKNFYEETKRYDNIVTNSPFGRNIPLFIEHALALADKKVAMFLNLNVLAGIGRYNTLWSQGKHPSRVWVFTERVTCFDYALIPKDGYVEDSGTKTYAWFVWDIGSDLPTEIRWIEPGFKKTISRKMTRQIVQDDEMITKEYSKRFVYIGR